MDGIKMLKKNNNLRKEVKQFKKQFNIKGVPDVEKLMDVADRLGFVTVGYEPKDREPEGYTYQSADKKIIYYSQYLNSLDLIIVLTHELAHIFLNHLRRSECVYDTSVYKEYEANVFTSIFLKGIVL